MPAAAHPSAFAGRVRSFAHPTKPTVDIQIGDEPGQPHSYVHAFSTGDKIEGCVSLHSPHETKLDGIEIYLLGTTKTYVERITPASMNGRTEAFQQFLKLSQPVSEDEYPESRVFEAGQTYRFPFKFVVPQHLLPSACRHNTANDKFKDAHLQLPPSVGDAETSGHGSTLLDDMCPAMARVWYGIRACVTRNRETDQKPLTVVEKMRKIRIVPATDEQPPVDIDGTDDEYCLRKEKNIKKGLLKSKTGRLAMEAPQPKSLRLPPPSDDPSTASSATTMATIALRFDPAETSSRPPRLTQLVSRLKVATFFSSIPPRDYPSKTKIMYEPSQGLFVDIAQLASRCMASATWQRHEAGADSPSAPGEGAPVPAAPAPHPQPTAAYAPHLPFYTARIVVPINIPKNKILVPTFHSCLVSRIYVLELTLCNLSSGSVNSNAMLKVPLQVSSETGAPLGNESRQGSFGTLSSLEEEFFQPRSVAPPTDDRRRSRSSRGLWDGAAEQQVEASLPAPPPEYSHFAPRTARTGGHLAVENFAHSPLYSMVR